MQVHLEVDAVLNVVGAYACDASIYDHILGVKSTDNGSVVILYDKEEEAFHIKDGNG